MSSDHKEVRGRTAHELGDGTGGKGRAGDTGVLVRGRRRRSRTHVRHQMVTMRYCTTMAHTDRRPHSADAQFPQSRSHMVSLGALVRVCASSCESCRGSVVVVLWWCMMVQSATCALLPA